MGEAALQTTDRFLPDIWYRLEAVCFLLDYDGSFWGPNNVKEIPEASMLSGSPVNLSLKRCLTPLLGHNVTYLLAAAFTLVGLSRHHQCCMVMLHR